MKKIFYAIVLLCSLSIVSCKNTATTETKNDSTAMTTNIKEEAVQIVHRGMIGNCFLERSFQKKNKATT